MASGGTVPYPYAGGKLSNDEDGFVGLDVGDPAHALPIRALPGLDWHDIMTHCDDLWLSDFTYRGIRDRLQLEDALPPLPAPSAAPGVGGTSAGRWPRPLPWRGPRSIWRHGTHRIDPRRGHGEPGTRDGSDPIRLSRAGIGHDRQ